VIEGANGEIPTAIRQEILSAEDERRFSALGVVIACTLMTVTGAGD
jgi:hypothetical protein